MPLQIDKTSYGGWPNCYRITNGEVEAILTSDVGPRVIRFGFIDGRNVFKEFDEQMGGGGEATWMPRGGHRIWAAPEDAVRTYARDNGPVHVQVTDGVITATQPPEEITGLEKQLAVKMASSGSGVEVVHRIRNASSQPASIAAWALSMMAPGGVGIHGFPPRGTHPEVLQPTNPLVMWAFTNLADPRWKFTQKYLILRQAPGNPVPNKLGTFNPNTWGAYLLGTELFIKRFRAEGSPAEYPDYGASYETFTNAQILELETLGPLRQLAPGDFLEHVERWTLHRDVKLEAWDDEELDRVLLPLVTS